MSQRKDLTIDEAIRDPMIRLVMKADRVNPRAFEAMLRTVADEQGLSGAAPPSYFLQDPGSVRSRRLSRSAHSFKEAGSSKEVCVSW
ncbi:hypothetical protein [Mesorhizobium sp. M0847]|uniref:hypothetical protein n=1 Tax=unclassified Mesorhizobium TaxID=325217 RepID=UPI0033395A12